MGGGGRRGSLLWCRDHLLVLSWRNEAANLDTSALEAIAQRIHALTL